MTSNSSLQKKENQKSWDFQIVAASACLCDFQESRLPKNTCFGSAGLQDFLYNLSDTLTKLRNKEIRIEIWDFQKLNLTLLGVISFFKKGHSQPIFYFCLFYLITIGRLNFADVGI